MKFFSQEKTIHITQKLPLFLQEFFIFGIKQAYASIFGILILVALLVTNYIDFNYISRFDFIFLFVIFIQALLILLKLEYKKECYVIIIFHILATLMELFKTSPEINSWSYQGESIFMIYTVPLFAGFLYSAVGSYLARVWRIFNFSFTHYPPFWLTAMLALFSYVNLKGTPFVRQQFSS